MGIMLCILVLGTVDGLMQNLLQNDGMTCAAIDEFSTFIDMLDSKQTGNAERSRYLSLWSGMSWQKKTKTAGLETITNPRFQFCSFLQNFYLMDMIVNNNQFDGFLPRFLVATPKEIFVPLKEKMKPVLEDEMIDISQVLSTLHENFFNGGVTWSLSENALKLFEEFHDIYVMNEREKDLFDDKKSMILSKAIGNVLRVSGIQAAMREAVNSIKNDTEMVENFIVTAEDMQRAMNIVKYSVRCLTSLVDSLSGKP